MERLTIPDEKIDGGIRRTVIDARKVKEHAMTIYWALKKYEDTDLTPEQIRKLKERDTGMLLEDIKGNKKDNGYLRFGTCPSCGRRVSNVEGGNFCQNCGQRLKWEE